MSLLNVTNIQIDNNPANFQTPIKMHITFECIKEIPEEDVIDWELIYIGSAKDDSKDIVLDQFSMGQLEQGVMQFTIESEAPDSKKIPSKEDLLNITAIILSVSYKKQEFFRVGYYVYNQYVDAELIENDPPEVLIDRVQRSILADKPRITRFPIQWEAKVGGVQPANTNTNINSMFQGDSEYAHILQEFQERSQSQLILAGAQSKANPFLEPQDFKSAFQANASAQQNLSASQLNFAPAASIPLQSTAQQQHLDTKQEAFAMPQGSAFL